MKISIIIRSPIEEDRLRELQDVVGSLRERGHRVRAHMTFEAGDAVLFARHASRARAELVIAVGGDGTVNEVVNGLARSSRRPRLGIVPFGTANDFATALGLPTDPGAAVEVAVGGRSVEADVAEVNGRCFINVSTGGFGAEATEETARETKRLLGPLAYALSGAKKLIDFRPLRARFRADGRLMHDGDFVFFAVGNSRLTGGGTRITPRAEVQDGKLDVVVVGGVSRLDFLALLPDLRAGTHIESPDVLYFRTHVCEVEAPDVLPVNVDGEPLRARRYRYRVLDRPLTLMVPDGE